MSLSDDPKRKAVCDAMAELRDNVTSDLLADTVLRACAACVAGSAEHLDHCMDLVRRRVAVLKKYRSVEKRRACVSDIAEAVSDRLLAEYGR